jgi:hypothetical protein
LAPGVPSVVAYTVFARILTANGLPNLMGLMLASVTVEAPFLWWLMLRLERNAGRPVTWKTLFPWHATLRWTTYVAWGVPLILFGFVMMGAVSPAVQERLLDSVFAWVPRWFAMRPDPEAMLASSRGVLLTMWGLMLLMVVVGGVTQEGYFRGYLLPRMAWLGRGAPVLNAALFAVFHMAAPWGWLVFFVGTLPWSVLVFWKRSIQLGLFMHVGMLLLQWLMFTLLVFGVAQLPPSG